MILDLDIGNTLSKWRLKERSSNQIKARGAVWTHEEWRPGEDIPDLGIVEVVRISNVARSEVLIETVGMLSKRVMSVHVARSESEALGVRNGYEHPGLLGVDRWLGVLAGYRLSQGCVVVDCGSAITMDIVLPGGEHLGGYILPGLRLMKESLRLNTRNVPIDPDSEPATLRVPGKKTLDAVGHGVYMTAVSTIDRLYAEACDRYGAVLPLFVTGGDSEIIARGLKMPHAVWRDMVYGGLEALFPVTQNECNGQMTGAPVVPPVESLEWLRKGLAFSSLL
ncbi:type III pantothenate kinase [Zymobacter palmae]|uniref:Type III pantothenate kinase n=1 Tax=Zymobacter palmae TaxID=33074 RepID=A0A348HBT0_9GAMM|nr:type III pantothenate kinase [Zymobacter palmae]BBG29082.1 putative transcriptional acitvator, Baf [Zymobacter palmae]